MSSNSQYLKPTLELQPLIKSNYSSKLKITISFPSDSLHTKQSFKDECDINLLMSRYMENGQLPNINEAAPQYLDVSEGYDYQAAMEYIAGANSLFQELPSSIRNRFENDPGAFIEFCSNENNRLELTEMGLLRPPTPDLIPTPQLTPTNSTTGEDASL